MKRPVYAVISYMLLVYCKLSSYYPVFGAMNAELVFALIIIVRVSLYNSINVKFFSGQSQVNKYLLYFITWLTINFLVFAWNRSYSWEHAVYHFIKVVILYYMIVMAIDTENDLLIFFWAFLIMFAVLAYEPVYGFVFQTGGSQHMYGTNYISEIGILSGHVALANNMNQMIPLAFYIWFAAITIKQKIIYAIPLCIFITAVIGSGSRGGVAGLALFGLLIIYNSRNKIKTGAIATIVLIIIAFSSNQMASTAGRISTDSAEGRFVGLTHGIGMFMKGNIFGVGPGCYLFARQKYFSYYMESHNIYGEVIGDLGLPGVVLWFLFIRQVFYNLAESKKKLVSALMGKSKLYWLCTGIQCSLIIRLFISMGSHGLYYFYWYVMAAMSFSILTIINNIESELLIKNK